MAYKGPVDAEAEYQRALNAISESEKLTMIQKEMLRTRINASYHAYKNVTNGKNTRLSLLKCLRQAIMRAENGYQIETHRY